MPLKKTPNEKGLKQIESDGEEQSDQQETPNNEPLTNVPSKKLVAVIDKEPF